MDAARKTTMKPAERLRHLSIGFATQAQELDSEPNHGDTLAAETDVLPTLAPCLTSLELKLQTVVKYRNAKARKYAPAPRKCHLSLNALARLPLQRITIHLPDHVICNRDSVSAWGESLRHSLCYVAMSRMDPDLANYLRETFPKAIIVPIV